MKYYQKEIAIIVEEFNSNVESGLTSEQVVVNRELYGENRMPEKKEDPYWKVFLKNFTEPIVLVLLGAVVLSFASSYYAIKIEQDVIHGKEALYEALAILILIFINAMLGFWQEISARKSLNSLKALDNRMTKVLRNNSWGTLPAYELVDGDIIKVSVGDFIEADVRWVETNELQVTEAHLTGESDVIFKISEALIETRAISDQTNMGFSGSAVASGQGLGIVVAVGEKSELGNIAHIIQDVEEKQAPLQMIITKLTKTLMKISLGLVIFTFCIGIFRAGEITVSSITSVLSTSIALAVASIPDALPAVLSIVLTIGAVKMAKNKGLIKTLNSVETLGATSYICSDKTGTLTKNEMTVVKFYENEKIYNVSGIGYDVSGEITFDESEKYMNAGSLFLQGAILCNESSIKNVDGKIVPFGNPTEIALSILGNKAGVKKETLLSEIEIIKTLPFSSERKMMSVIIKHGSKYCVFVKGAPDILINKCHGIVKNDVIENSLVSKTDFINVVEDFADEALRTIAVAYKEITEDQVFEGSTDELESDLIMAGVAGIIDPARDEVKESIKELQKANIDVVMITGDHEKTAKAIAYELGIIKDKNAPVINGMMIENFTDEKLFQTVLQTHVYARVSPEHKQRIVEQLQRHEKVVAMTGDGVNDAPALSMADIGIAMGIAGTEVTKDSADLILLNDKFTTIEKTVKSGRTIYANIKNFIRHELTTNVAEVLSLLLGLLFYTKTIGSVSVGTPVMTALMILWVNMVSDAIPSFALGYDVAESDIMKESPRPLNESILANYTWSRVLIRGGFMGGIVYIAFIYAAKNGLTSGQAQTVAFLTLVYGQLWHVFDARSSKTLFRRNPFGNKQLIVAVLFAGIASYLVTILPFFNVVMGTEKLPTNIYWLVLFIPLLPTIILSTLKEIFNIKLW